MRHLIRLIESADYPMLYHGTKSHLHDEIMQRGLTAETDVSHREFGPGIYLSDSIEMARQYGSLVFAVEVSRLDLHRMSPDDFELMDYFNGEWGDGTEGDYSADEFRPTGIFDASWKDSLRICHQCKYRGDIPAGLLSTI